MTRMWQIKISHNYDVWDRNALTLLTLNYAQTFSCNGFIVRLVASCVEKGSVVRRDNSATPTQITRGSANTWTEEHKIHEARSCARRPLVSSSRGAGPQRHAWNQATRSTTFLLMMNDPAASNGRLGMKNGDWSAQTSKRGRRCDVTLSRDIRRSLMHPPPIYCLFVANQTQNLQPLQPLLCQKRTVNMRLTKADAVSRMYL